MLLAGAILAGASPALGRSSREEAARQKPRVEITPFVGYQIGGFASSFDGELRIERDMTYGLMFDLRMSPDTTLQFLFNRQDTAVNVRDKNPLFPRRQRVGLVVDYYHLGGAVELGKGNFQPYFALSIGATRFDPEAAGFRDEWRFSMGVGGGFKAYVSNRFGFRADIHVWPTLVNTSGGFLCSTNAGCLAAINSDFITQANATAGFFLGL